MMPAWVRRRAVWVAATAAAGGAFAVLAGPPGSASGQVVPGLTAPADPAPDPTPDPTQAVPRPAGAPKFDWGQTCALSVDDGRIVVRCGLTIDVLRSLDESYIAVPGIAGTCSLQITPRRYEVRNVRRAGPWGVTVAVESHRFATVLRMDQWPAADKGDREKVVHVIYYQPGIDPNRRVVVRGEDCRLTVTGPGVPGDTFMVSVNDFDALRKEHPHEANRYVRPMLRRLGADLFRVDPFAARQVLFPAAGDEDDDGRGAASGGVAATGPSGPATTPAPVATRPATDKLADDKRANKKPEGDESAVRPLLAELASPSFPRRQAAVARLAELGPPAVAALARVDRKGLSAQQALEVDLLAAAATPLSADEARKLRSDPHFLVDCLYVADPAIRAAAATRLARLTRTDPARFAPVLAARPAGDVDAQSAAVEDLRDELIPKAK